MECELFLDETYLKYGIENISSGIRMWPLMGPYLEPQVVEKPMLKRFYWHGFPSNAPAVNFLSAISKGILIFPFSQVQKDFIVTQNVKKDWIIFLQLFSEPAIWQR